MTTKPGNAEPEPGKLRLDKWLWHTRLCKTRTLAAALCTKGLVRLDGQNVKPSQSIKPGTLVSIDHGGWQRDLVVVALGKRRGPFAEASGLYREIDRRKSDTAEPWQALLADDPDMRHDFACGDEDAEG